MSTKVDVLKGALRRVTVEQDEAGLFYNDDSEVADVIQREATIGSEFGMNLLAQGLAAIPSERDDESADPLIRETIARAFGVALVVGIRTGVLYEREVGKLPSHLHTTAKEGAEALEEGNVEGAHSALKSLEAALAHDAPAA